MGRWSQRRLGGGAAPLPIIMVAARIDDAADIPITWSANIDAATFGPSDFTTFPNGFASIGISQLGAREINANFSDDISTESSITYLGTYPGMPSPQTVNL